MPAAWIAPITIVPELTAKVTLWLLIPIVSIVIAKMTLLLLLWWWWRCS